MFGKGQAQLIPVSLTLHRTIYLHLHRALFTCNSILLPYNSDSQWPISTVPQVVVSPPPNHKVILLLLLSCNFAVRNHSVNIWHTGYLLWPPRGVLAQGWRTAEHSPYRVLAWLPPTPLGVVSELSIFNWYSCLYPRENNKITFFSLKIILWQLQTFV